MNEDYKKLKDNLISIASALFRFRQVFEKAISRLDVEDQSRYCSHFVWLNKRVTRALEDLNLKISPVDGKPYDPGMAVTPLNLEDFEPGDTLYVEHTVEPIIMEGDIVVKTGTVLLGRKKQ